MAREQKSLPGAEMSVEIALQLVDFPADTGNFDGLLAGGSGEAGEFGDVAFESVNGALFLFLDFRGGADSFVRGGLDGGGGFRFGLGGGFLRRRFGRRGGVGV